MTGLNRWLLPVGTGLLGALFLLLLYFGIVTWAESFEHALEFFWQDRWNVLPIVTGFGIQAALYTVLKKGLYLPVTANGASSTALSGGLTGAGGGTSTLAMVACCAHHLTDVLPILGLSAVAAFLAKYRTAFMLFGLGTTIVGITVMLYIILRDRKKAILNLHVASNFAQLVEIP